MAIGRRRFALLTAFACAGFALAAGVDGSGARTQASSPVEELVATCPSADEIAAIDARITITIEGDPTAGTSVCGMTRLRERAYQAMRVMRVMRFSRPLPWTEKPLWDWFAGAIKGIRFRSDITTSFCCDPADTIDVQTRNLAALGTTRWIGLADGNLLTGLSGLVELFVHEARHNEAKPHTCNGNDQTVAEQGAWAVEAELTVWEALYSGSFLDAAELRSVYRALALGEAFFFYRSRFCAEPHADIATAVAPSVTTTAPGETFALTTTVTNRGPDLSPQTFLANDVPTGTELVSSTPSQGTCAPNTPQQVSCELGSLAAGAGATVTLVLRVIATSGAIGYDANYSWPGYVELPLGSYAVGTAIDTEYFNNFYDAHFSVPVRQATTATTAPPPAAPPAKPTSNPKPKPPKCKLGRHSTKKRPCRK